MSSVGQMVDVRVQGPRRRRDNPDVFMCRQRLGKGCRFMRDTKSMMWAPIYAATMAAGPWCLERFNRVLSSLTPTEH